MIDLEGDYLHRALEKDAVRKCEELKHKAPNQASTTPRKQPFPG